MSKIKRLYRKIVPNYKYFDNKRKVKILEKEVRVLFAILLALLLPILAYHSNTMYKIYTSYNLKNSYDSTVYDYVVDYGDLNELQSLIASDAVSTIKPIYLPYIKEIYFVTNYSVIYKKHNGFDSGRYNGMNYDNGVIYVEYQEDTNYLREILCHEILHSYFNNDFVAHEIIYDLGEQQVCYDTNEIYFGNSVSDGGGGGVTP